MKTQMMPEQLYEASTQDVKRRMCLGRSASLLGTAAFAKLLGGEASQAHAASSLHRQARFDALPAPRGREDVARLLSDEGDEEYPVFREMTLASLVLDASRTTDPSAVDGAPLEFAWTCAMEYPRKVWPSLGAQSGPCVAADLQPLALPAEQVVTLGQALLSAPPPQGVMYVLSLIHI